MARQLWLLRHGEAVPHDSRDDDADRELTARGERQAAAAGAALARLGIEFAAIYTSPKVRAADTAKLACEELGIEPQHEPKLAGGPFDPEALAAGLGDDVLLVGHDPDFSMAVHTLTGAQVRMKKGGLAGVEKGELKVLLRPDETRAIAD
jgi:phosphohistidine phosphatase